MFFTKRFHLLLPLADISRQRIVINFIGSWLAPLSGQWDSLFIFIYSLVHWLLLIDWWFWFLVSEQFFSYLVFSCSFFIVFIFYMYSSACKCVTPRIITSRFVWFFMSFPLFFGFHAFNYFNWILLTIFIVVVWFCSAFFIILLHPLTY